MDKNLINPTKIDDENIKENYDDFENIDAYHQAFIDDYLNGPNDDEIEEDIPFLPYESNSVDDNFGGDEENNPIDYSYQNPFDMSYNIFDSKQITRQDLTKLVMTVSDWHVDDKDNSGETLLMKAVSQHRLNLVEMLVKKGARVDLADNHGNTALSRALSGGCDLDIAECLLNNGAWVDDDMVYSAYIDDNETLLALLLDHGGSANFSVDIDYDNEHTMLMEAADNHDIDFVKLVLDHAKKINIDVGDIEGRTALQHAIDNNDLEIVKLIVAHGADINEDNGGGRSALVNAVENNVDIKIIKFLIENGADVNQCGNLSDVKDDAFDDDTPALVFAMRKKNSEVAELLVENGADMDVEYSEYVRHYRFGEKYGGEYKYRGPVLDYAIKQRMTSLAKCMIEHGAAADTETLESAYILSRDTYDPDFMKFFIEHGVDVDAQDADHYTALIDASVHGDVDFAKYLLSKGADINHRTRQNATALHKACKYNQLDMVKFLVENGADPNARDSLDCATPLMYSCWSDNLEMAQYLIDHGADVNKYMGAYGGLVLSRASALGKIDFVKLFVENGAKVNDGDYSGFTALMHACEENRLEVAKYLIDHGADVNLKNSDGKSAILLATHFDHRILGTESHYYDIDHTNRWVPFHYEGEIQMLELLLNSGADVDTKDAYGRTLIMHSISLKEIPMVKLLVKHGAHVDAKTAKAAKMSWVKAIIDANADDGSGRGY